MSLGPEHWVPLRTAQITSNFRGSFSGIAFVPLGRRLKHTLTPILDGLLEYISAHFLLTGHAETLYAGRLRGKVAQDSAKVRVKSVAPWEIWPPASGSPERTLVTPSGMA